MKNILRNCAVVLVLSLVSVTALGQLPELGSPSTVTGATTTARFLGGASADNGATFGSSFAFDQAIDIDVEIQVETSHVNTVGNLYVFILWDDIWFQRLESGAYEVWDLSIENIQAAFPAKTLQSSEPINIVNDVAFGPAGVADTTLSIFVAYDTMAVANEFFYSGAPLNITIEPEEPAEPPAPTAQQLFESNISAQIIQARCILCHRSGGAAGATSLLYVSSSVSDHLNTNFNTLANYINGGGGNTLVSKAQGMSGHGGGVQLQSGSQDLANLQEFVNAVLAE